MMVPTLHLNGTSRKQLIDENLAAARAVNAAMEAIASAAPNGRDFYVQGPDAIGKAGVEHRERIAKLKEVYDDIMRLVEAIDDQEGRR